MDPDTLSSILSERMIVAGTILVGGLILGVFVTIWVVIGTRQATAQAKEREESRRELAAYVAEGSISVEDAARLLTADGSIGHRIMNEIGGLKKAGDRRSHSARGEAAVDEVLKPQTT